MPFHWHFYLERFSFNIIFIFCLICVAISLFLSFFLKVQEITLTQEQAAEMKGFKLSNFIEPKSVPITIVAAVTAFCYSGVSFFLTFFAMKTT